MDKIGYLIVPNFYAPKCNRYIVGESPEKIHAISVNYCNFHCNYCNFHQRKLDATYCIYDDISIFEAKIDTLLKTGKSFKFTGGEPTLNKNLKRDLTVVRNKGGIIYLDSNCSNVTVIKDLIESNLIDVLGVSLKGLSREEAVLRSGVKKSELCWDNVWKSIQIASNSNAEVIVTYVADDNFSYEKLLQLSKLLENFPNIYLKINNYQKNNGIPENGIESCNNDLLELWMKKLSETHKKWIGHMILIRDSESVQNFSKVQLY